MKMPVYGLNGKEIKEIDLNDSVFNIDVSDGSIYYAIRNELANKRIGTACTKTRGEVAARAGARSTSTKKPWRQKGTGRARAGRRGSPIWVGGGTAFGPKPRDYSYKMPKKIKQLAVKSILSMKTKEENVKIIEDFACDSGKTRDLLKMLKKVLEKDNTAIILQDDGRMIKRAGRNVPNINLLSYNRLRAHDIFYSKKLIITESAALRLNDFYNEKELQQVQK